MEPITIAAAVAPLLVPFLRGAGAQFQERLADRAGDEAAEAVSGLWSRVRARLGGEPEADAEVEEERLRDALAEVLAEDPALAERTETLLIRGDRNVVQRGRTNINISGGRDIRIGDV